MKDLIIKDVKNPQEIEEWLKKSSKNSSSVYYYMEDEYSNNPIIRKMENFEIEERMSYSFEKSTFGWFWKSDNDNSLIIKEMSQLIWDIINTDYR